jgi:para-aminobenzoate synthetase component I
MVEKIAATDVKELINKSAALGKSFLFAVDFEMEHGYFAEDPLNCDEILFRIGNVSNYKSEKGQKNLITEDKQEVLIPAIVKVEEVSPGKYNEKFLKVRDGLLRGDSYLVNLTCKTKIRLDLTFEEIFLRSESPFALYIPGKFVCFSPERFVRIENREISSRPMKGTIKASIPDAERRILNDYKESSEHYTITDLIRNDIGEVSGKVWVEKFRYIDKIGTKEGDLLQVSSDIRGLLPEGYLNSLGDIIFTMLPAGSVSGAPKHSTLKIIAGAEGEKRGFYTGIFGYFDGKVFDSAVLIRFIEKDENGELWYRSGGGITVNSNPEEEYNEMLDKIYLPFQSRNR